MLNNKTIILVLGLVALSYTQWLGGVPKGIKEQRACIRAMGDFLSKVENAHQESKKSGLASMQNGKALSAALYKLATKGAFVGQTENADQKIKKDEEVHMDKDLAAALHNLTTKSGFLGKSENLDQEAKKEGTMSMIEAIVIAKTKAKVLAAALRNHAYKGDFQGKVENPDQETKKDKEISMNTVKALAKSLHNLVSDCANITMNEPTEECLESVPALTKDIMNLFGKINDDFSKIVPNVMDLVAKVQDSIQKCGSKRFNAKCTEIVNIAQKKKEAITNGESYEHEQIVEIIRGMKAACF